MTKSDKKQIDKALATGDAAYLAQTIAPIHRAGSAATRAAMIDLAIVHNLFAKHLSLVAGCLIA